MAPLLWAILTAAGDQATKALAEARLTPGGLLLLNLPLPGWVAGLLPLGGPPPGPGTPLLLALSLEPSRNPGIAFSLLARGGWGTAAAWVGALLLGIATLRLRSLRARPALALLWGGAVGNGIDRILLGGVRDWIVLSLFPSRGHLALNLADLALLLGGTLLSAHLLRAYPSPSSPERP
jgi:signal peptidase II